MLFNKKEKIEKADYSEDRFMISISKDGNDYFVIVWDMWLKSLKECYGRRKFLPFKNDIPAKEINIEINAFIKGTKDMLRKEFEEEIIKEGEKNAKR